MINLNETMTPEEFLAACEAKFVLEPLDHGVLILGTNGEMDPRKLGEEGFNHVHNVCNGVYSYGPCGSFGGKESSDDPLQKLFEEISKQNPVQFTTLRLIKYGVTSCKIWTVGNVSLRYLYDDQKYDVLNDVFRTIPQPLERYDVFFRSV